MKRNNIFISALILASLLSCNITKQYNRPETYSLEQYRNSIELKDSTSIANINWQDFFHDKTLIKHIETGLANNFDLLRAQENLNISKAMLKQSKANFFPNLQGSIENGFNKPSTKTFNGKNLPEKTTFNNVSMALSFSWEIDIWSKIQSQKKSALAQYFQTENVKRLIQTELINLTVNYYYNLLALDAKLNIIHSTIKNREEGIEAIKALKIAGNVSEVAVKQNEALLYSAQSLLIDIENQINLTENAFSVLLGIAPQKIDRSTLFTQEFKNDLMVGIPIQLISNRPDVLAAEYGFIQAFELTNVARASFYPNLSITGSGGLNSENFSDIFSPNAIFANIAGNLLQPIFNQRKLKTQKEVRLSQQEIALLDYKQTVLTSYQEIANELSNYNTSVKKLEIKLQEEKAYTQSLEYSEELQKEGFVNYLEVLRAKDMTLNTQIEVIDIRLTQLISRANLYKSLGGGWN